MKYPGILLRNVFIKYIQNVFGKPTIISFFYCKICYVMICYPMFFITYEYSL